MIDLEEFKTLRQSIRERHAKVLSEVNVKTKVEENEEDFKSIRQHPRWKELIGKSNDDDEKEEIFATTNESLFGPGFIPSESTVRNDYSQRYIDTNQSEFPGNAVKNPEKQSRFEEYPKLQNLIQKKSDLLNQISIQPTYLKVDLLDSIRPTPSRKLNDEEDSIPTPFHLSSLLPIKYDVVIIDPPLEAYEWESMPSTSSRSIWSWEQLASLPIPTIMAKESFIFFWVGSGASDGLERGREVLQKWGFRRCEDIVWVRRTSEENSTMFQSSSTFNKSSQHCLMGIRGTVRRSTDVGFVHCNIDTDVIIWPGETAENTTTTTSSSSHTPPIDTRSKPPEMMDLIENFCLGTRRLELFGRNRNLRRGWLTVGIEVGPDQPGWKEAVEGKNPCSAADTNQFTESLHSPIAYDKVQYDSAFHVDRAGCTLAERSNLVPFNEEIDELRPKSPRSSNQERREFTTKRKDQTFTNISTNPHQTRSFSPYSTTPVNPANIYPGVGQPQLPIYQPTIVDPYSSNAYIPMHPQFQHQYPTAATALPPSIATTPSISDGTAANSPINPGGAGLSGLGAGGRSVVSVPSGSELLSGAQASVMLGQGQRPTNSTSGPVGLSRRTAKRG